MCDREMIDKWTREGGDWSFNRRQFAAMGMTIALTACAPAVRGGAAGEGEAVGVGEAALAEDTVSFETPDGMMDAFFVRPVSGSHPAILTWPDIAGLREAFRVMARRLAGQGHAVLVVNPYYRNGPAPQFEDFAGFRAGNGFEAVRPWREALTPQAIMRDARAAIGWLDERSEVDTSRGVGTHGYCMGGPFTVFTAAAVPDRVRAAASLHGGRLVQEEDAQSPHRLITETQANYLFAIAQNDDDEDPDVKTELRAAAEAAGRPAEIEVYPAAHGWTVIDSPAYDREAAERAWGRMSALFAETL